MAKYEVVVSNIGTVHKGENNVQARHEFNVCVTSSKQGFGRIAGESVTLFEDGEPIKEYQGTQEGE